MKNNKNTGVILAAGLGTRLREADSELEAKPLAAVDELTLLSRTIRGHEIAHRERVVIVVGWRAEAVERHVRTNYNGPLELEFAYNEHYRLKNGVSVLSASALVEDEFLLTMADHILDDDIMKRLRTHRPPRGGATLCVDYKLQTIFDIDDATKVLAEGDRIRRIGKEIEEYNCVDTGVFLCTRGVMDAIDGVYRETGDASLSDGIMALAEAGRMEALDIRDGFWQDVDTPEMLEHAEKLLKKRRSRSAPRPASGIDSPRGEPGRF